MEAGIRVLLTMDLFKLIACHFSFLGSLQYIDSPLLTWTNTTNSCHRHFLFHFFSLCCSVLVHSFFFSYFFAIVVVSFGSSWQQTRYSDYGTHRMNEQKKKMACTLEYVLICLQIGILPNTFADFIKSPRIAIILLSQSAALHSRSCCNA